MKTEILFASEGFKLVRGSEGYGEVPEHLRAEELFTQAAGRACFQIVVRGEEDWALSTAKRQWYSEKGHRPRVRLEITAPGAKVESWIEGLLEDDDGLYRADVLESAETAEYAAGETAAVFVQVSPEAAGNVPVRIRAYEAFGTHAEACIGQWELPIKVYPVRLPEARAFYLDLWQHPSNLARKAETPLWSDAHFEVIDRYAASMAALGQKSITVLAGDVPWRGQGCIDNARFPADLFEYAMIRAVRKAGGALEYDYSAMDRYIGVFEKHGVLGDIEVLGLCNIWMKPSFDDREIVPGDPEPYISIPCLDEQTGALSYLSDTREVDGFITALQAHFERTGRLARVRLAADEPANIPAYRRSIERIRRVAPKFRLKTAINHAEFIPEFSDYIDDFMPSLESVCVQFDELERIRRELTGKRFLWYVCCGPDHPNTFLRSDLCETRLIGALTRHMKFDGFLRWNYTVWPDDPRRDIRYGAFAAGDTNFVYPARNGYPLLSLRYMALRRAIEDFELLRRLDEAGRAQEADELAESVLREKDVRKYFFPAKEEGAPSDSLPLDQMCSVDYRDYEKMRRRALELLSER